MISKNISAKTGEPSTFWSNDNGQTWYRTKAEALAGNTSKQVNPDDYVYTKGFWAQNKKTFLVCAAFVVIIGLLFFLWHKSVITFHIHKG